MTEVEHDKLVCNCGKCSDNTPIIIQCKSCRGEHRPDELMKLQYHKNILTITCGVCEKLVVKFTAEIAPIGT